MLYVYPFKFSNIFSYFSWFHKYSWIFKLDHLHIVSLGKSTLSRLCNWQLAFLELLEERKNPWKKNVYACVNLGSACKWPSYSAQWVAMDAMQFYVIQTGLFSETIRIFGFEWSHSTMSHLWVIVLVCKEV